MTLLAAVAADTAIVVAVGLAMTTLLRRRSAALRHWMLVITLVSAAAVPALELVLPGWSVPLFEPQAPAVPMAFADAIQEAAGTQALDVTGAPVASAMRWHVIVLTIWLGGVAAALVALLVALTRLGRLSASACDATDARCRDVAARAIAAYGIHRPVRVLYSDYPAPVTWGMRRPRVLLPSSATGWPDERLRVVLFHELAHVGRGDWGVQMLAAVLCSVYWFNPLLWIAARRLRQESERASDDLVLANGVPGTDYAQQLLAMAQEAGARRSGWSAATAIVHPSTLEERIRAMLDVTLNRTPLSVSGRACAVVVMIAITLPVAAAETSAPRLPEPAAVDVLLPGSAVDASADAETTSLPPAPAEPSAGSTPIAVAVTLPPRAHAGSAPVQEAGTASISGALYDQHSGLLPDVEVSLTHEGSGQIHTARSDASGAFAFQDLAPGNYVLVTSLRGFAPVRNLVGVGPGASLHRNIVMPLGVLQETVSVESDGTEAPGRSGLRPRPLREIPEPRVPSPCVGRIGGCIKVPTKVFDVRPVYPQDLASAKVGGVVRLAGRIGIDGYMSDLQVVDVADSSGSAPHPELVVAALEAVRQWEFNPTLLNGAPVEANAIISVHFTAR